MSQADLNRVRTDLETMKQAAGVGLPFGWEDVRANTCCALCGSLIAAYAWLGPWEHRGLVLIPLSLALLAGLRAAVSVRRRRAEQPARWREHRLAGMAVVLFAPLAVGYMYWERRLGMPREMVGAASVFFVGVGVLTFAAINRDRLYYVGAALPLMAFGLAIPLCSAAQTIIAAGLCMTAGGLAMAALQQWQLRTCGAEHGSH
jgi:hypothetical protein